MGHGSITWPHMPPRDVVSRRTRARAPVLIVVVVAALWLSPATLAASAVAQTGSRATTTVTEEATTSTTPDPDLGRRLGVHPPDSQGDVVQGGPLWMGAVMTLAGGAGIAFALVRRRSRAQGWPKRG